MVPRVAEWEEDREVMFDNLEMPPHAGKYKLRMSSFARDCTAKAYTPSSLKPGEAIVQKYTAQFARGDAVASKWSFTAQIKGVNNTMSSGPMVNHSEIEENGEKDSRTGTVVYFRNLRAPMQPGDYKVFVKGQAYDDQGNLHTAKAESSPIRIKEE
ncbi:hypothetical protein B0H67DRAFT_686042 [Lasiosphaeris hirsuta]|uniref:Uncharacterized protein n=1 Tax=Lasiosphaeris hirsuta TaxID=260670 RepID=A0AA40A1X7_9PEZI|nr:hypothetical protein B0H67DRAFT_686042 [Lasiosphaeris hirsuta]